MNLIIKIVKRFYCLMILFFLEISWKMYFLFFSNYEMKRIICCWKEAFLWLVKKASFVEVLRFIWCRMKCEKGGKKTWKLIRHNFLTQHRAKKCFMLRISLDMLSVDASHHVHITLQLMQWLATPRNPNWAYHLEG